MAQQIKGFLEASFVDWRGRMCAVLFFGGCNFRCPFCHNHPLVLSPESLSSLDFKEVLHRLASLQKWLGGVCISGGEPTLDPDLPKKLFALKKEGWAVKLDTNGSRPRIIEQLLVEGLVDMVAMDVKAPLQQERYNQCAGTMVDLAPIKKSIDLLKKSSIAHEFRMTVVPRFHSKADILEWAAYLGKDSWLTLQNFNPQSTMDPDLSRDKGFAADTFCQFKDMIAGLRKWQ